MGAILSRQKFKSRIRCRYCKSDYSSYYNPLFCVYHIGKQNGLIICLECYNEKNNI